MSPTAELRVEAAINTQMMRARRTSKAALTARDQEAAMKQLEQLQEAAHIIRAEIKEEVVRIPGPAPAVQRTQPAHPPQPPALHSAGSNDAAEAVRMTTRDALSHLESGGRSTIEREPTRLLLRVTEVAAVLGVSKNHVLKMHVSGQLGPRPIRLGRAVRWSREEIAAWVAAGCPARNKWTPHRQSDKS